MSLRGRGNEIFLKFFKGFVFVVDVVRDGDLGVFDF